MSINAPNSGSSTSEFQSAISFTRFTTGGKSRLSKSFTLQNGTVKKESGGQMQAGIAERLTVSSLHEFAALLPTLTPQQALSYGVNGHDRARIVVADALGKAKGKPGDLPLIARTRKHFDWPTGAGLMMLDYDPQEGRPALTCTDLLAALAAVCKPMSTAAAVWRPSASSCIYLADGTLHRGIVGQRLYMPVLDAADIPRAGKVLFDRLFLAGFGRIDLSKSGAFLLRTLIDASVFQPERLDFCGGAVCGTGLEQRLPEPVLFNADAAALDTRGALPDLTAEERDALGELLAGMKSALEPAQEETRTHWVAARVAAGLAKLPAEKRTETARDDLERVYRQAAEGGRLGNVFELTVKVRGGAAKGLTVAELLANRTKYHDATTLDPLEPDYPDGEGRWVGWLNLNDAAPFLTSQAHGGARYRLGSEAAQPADDESAQPDRSEQADQGEATTAGVPIHPDYCASIGERGGTFWIKHNESGDQFVFLANFRAEIQSETLVDDGAISTRRLEIAGTLAGGEPLPLAMVASGHFAQLNWVGEHWGTAAQIAPGIGLKDRLRYAIQVLSQKVQRRSVFAHTGWREVGSQWVYLSGDACIGGAGAVTGIDMELPGALADYQLEFSDAPATALYASLGLLECAPSPIATPLFLATYRALLSEALPVDFSAFLTGTTGSRKTEIAALVQAHFGRRWHGKHLPASWSSTANRLEQDAFRAKDAVLVVDDFCPGGASHDVARLHKEADRLLRAQGNRAGRGRMNADGSPRPAYFPRGLIVATGEDVPRGQSLRGRLLVLEFAPDTVNLDALTTMQQHAGDGRLAAAAGAFCQWLAPQMAELKKTLPPRFRQKRSELMGAGAHSRHPDTLAELMITAELFAQCAADYGVVLPVDWLETLTDALLQAGKDQSQFIATEEPAGRFVRLIHAALAAGLCHVKRKDGREPYASEGMDALGWQVRTYGAGDRESIHWQPQGVSIGWFEENNLYLEPDAAYRTAAQFADAQGQALPLSQRAMFKAMDDKKLIRSKAAGRTTTTLWIAGEKKRVLHISRAWGENIGSIGSIGSKPAQPDDFQNEKHGTDSGSSENLSVPSVPAFSDTSRSGTDNSEHGTDAKNYRFQNQPPNTLDDKDISSHGTDGTDGTAIPHPPYPQSVSESDAKMPMVDGETEAHISEGISYHLCEGDRLKLAKLPRSVDANPLLQSPLADRIRQRVLAAGPAGIADDELARVTEKAGAALYQQTLAALVKAHGWTRCNGRWIAGGAS